jgi:hypothetical protein
MECAAVEACAAAFVKTAALPPDAGHPLLEQLQFIQQLSDNRAYAAKSAQLRKLMLSNPENWYIDEELQRFYGITHRPTGYRFHLPKTHVPADISKTLTKTSVLGLLKSPMALATGAADDIALGAVSDLVSNKPAVTLEQTPLQNKALQRLLMQRFNVPADQVYREADYAKDYGADPSELAEHWIDLDIDPDSATRLKTVGDVEDFLNPPAPVKAAQSFYAEAARGHGAELLRGRKPVYNAGEGLLGALQRHAATIKQRGDRAIAEAKTWDRMQNAMDPQRSIRQTQAYLAGGSAMVQHPVDRLLQHEPVQLLPQLPRKP